MRFIILHYHILKNAGTTLENILDRNFGERFARLDTEHRDGRIEQSDIVDYLEGHPEVEAISSHQIHYPVPQARGYLFFDWCFLRDPIDRLRSTYDYFRQHPSGGDPLSEAANRLEFGPYVRCLLDRFPEQVDNPQTNLLANGAADRETVLEDLAPAMQRMRETVFLGVVDLYQQSIAAGRRRMRAIFPWLDFAAAPGQCVTRAGGIAGVAAFAISRSGWAAMSIARCCGSTCLISGCCVRHARRCGAVGIGSSDRWHAQSACTTG